MSPNFPVDNSKVFEHCSYRLAEDLVGVEHCAPTNLATKFPRIFERINLAWPTPESIAYIDGLMIADRVNRAGFSADVVVELFFLKELQAFLYPRNPGIGKLSVEELLHSPFNVRSLRDLVNRFEIQNSLDSKIGEATSPRDPLYKSPISPPSWGELASEMQVEHAAEITKPISRIGDVLMQFNLVSAQDMDRALLEQSTTKGPSHEPLGWMLVKAGKVDAIDVRKALAFQANMLLLHLDALIISAQAHSTLSRELAFELGVVPVYRFHNTLVVAMDNPLSYKGNRATEALRKITGLSIKPGWASTPSIERRLKNYNSGPVRMDI